MVRFSCKANTENTTKQRHDPNEKALFSWSKTLHVSFEAFSYRFNIPTPLCNSLLVSRFPLSLHGSLTQHRKGDRFFEFFFRFDDKGLWMWHTNWELVRRWLFIFSHKNQARLLYETRQVRSKFSCWYLTHEISSPIILLFRSIIFAGNRQVFVALSTNIRTSRENNHSDSHQLRRSVPHISCGLCHSLCVP